MTAYLFPAIESIAIWIFLSSRRLFLKSTDNTDFPTGNSTNAEPEFALFLTGCASGAMKVYLKCISYGAGTGSRSIRISSEDKVLERVNELQHSSDL